MNHEIVVEIRQVCTRLNIPSFSVMPRLEQLIGDREISHHYLWEGPAPQDPDTILDMCFLSDMVIPLRGNYWLYCGGVFWDQSHYVSNSFRTIGFPGVLYFNSRTSNRTCDTPKRPRGRLGQAPMVSKRRSRPYKFDNLLEAPPVF